MLGAGVVGLTSAVCLAEAGVRVAVRTADPPERTTSVAAGAIWGPVRVGPTDRVHDWARVGLETFRALCAEPDAGVAAVTGVEVSRVPADPPYWSGLLDGVRLCRPAELPAGYVAGWRYTAPVVTMPTYLGYLRARLERAGGRLHVAPVSSLAEATAAAPVVVNCTGVAAHHLVPDPDVLPIRGQVVIAANPGIEEFYIDHSPTPPEVVYLFPHGRQIVLGGSYAEGRWDLEPDPAIAERIVRDCAAVHPALRDAEILEHRVGLRPGRPEVRLERVSLPDGRALWHNYGHGGGGVTLSWGCAREIAAAVTGNGSAVPASPG